MDAYDIEEQTGAIAPVSTRLMSGAIQIPESLTSSRKKLRDALDAIGAYARSGDMTGAPAAPQLIVEIHQALSAFGDLWHGCAAEQGDTGNLSISVMGELTSAWLMNQLVEQARQLECSITDDNQLVLWGEIVTGAMSATRWAARWSWLRYKQPSTRLWANAAYLYEVSKRLQSQEDPARVSRAQERCANVEQEFARLLFAQWVSPISLSIPAQLLLDQLLSESSAQPRVSPTPTSPEDALFDAGSGLVLLQRQRALGSSIRYISFGPLREELRKRVKQLALADVANAEPAKQVLNSVVGRRTRTLVRLGGRVEMLRRVQVCVGYHAITANLREPDQRFVEGFVLDRSEEGCRIRFERLSAETNRLCVGALLQLRDVFEEEVSLGIVRWLKRIDPAGWEVGIQMMRGDVHVQPMRTHQGAWPTGNMKEDVLFIDGENRGSGAPTLGVLPKHSASSGMQLLSEHDRLRCQVLTCVETGADFDVAVVADSDDTE